MTLLPRAKGGGTEGRGGGPNISLVHIFCHKTSHRWVGERGEGAYCCGGRRGGGEGGFLGAKAALCVCRKGCSFLQDRHYVHSKPQKAAAIFYFPFFC